MTNDYETLEQQIVSLWKSRGMVVKTIEVNYPEWKITIVEEVKNKDGNNRNNKC